MNKAGKVQLRERVVKLGYTEADAANVLAYVREDAPVTIHLKQETLSLLLKDPMYRNQFETGTSAGTLGGDRPKWEDIIFGGHYRAAQAQRSGLKKMKNSPQIFIILVHGCIDADFCIDATNCFF